MLTIEIYLDFEPASITLTKKLLSILEYAVR